MLDGRQELGGGLALVDLGVQQMLHDLAAASAIEPGRAGPLDVMRAGGTLDDEVPDVPVGDAVAVTDNHLCVPSDRIAPVKVKFNIKSKIEL